MKQEDTIKILDQEIRRLKDELGQLQRARKAFKRKEYEVAAF
ncbi:MAG: hypothetical protein ACFFDS_04405 [Candidatus Thorarchaeota archaeon]